MAVPATTTRADPGATNGFDIRMDDGHSTKIAFDRDPDVSFWEKTVQPPGVEGGDPIDTTTMHNTTYRTMASQRLITTTAITITAAYDPEVKDQIIANLVNQEGSITIHYPDGSTEDFFGYLQTFEPQPHVQGEPPEATITVVPTNNDPADGTEQGPVLTGISGT